MKHDLGIKNTGRFSSPFQSLFLDVDGV